MCRSPLKLIASTPDQTVDLFFGRVTNIPFHDPSTFVVVQRYPMNIVFSSDPRQYVLIYAFEDESRRDRVSL